MALHKFTPGGCRSNCETTTDCCPTGVCNAPHVSYRLTISQDGVPAATSIDLDVNVSSASACTWHDTTGVSYSYCGGKTFHAQLTIYTSSGHSFARVIVYDAAYPFLGATTLLSNAGSEVDLGASPADCGQTITDTFNVVNALCSGHTWTFSLEPLGAECSSTGTTAGAGGTCCPCENCRLMRDNFNRTAGTDLGANWTEEAGQWTLEAPSRLATDDTSAIALSTTTSSAVGIAVTAKGSTGDKIRLIAGYADSDNYFYAEFTWGASGSIKIVERASGSDTILQSSDFAFQDNEYARLFFCVDGTGNMVAKTTFGIGTALYETGNVPSGSQYGLGTGDTNSGNVQFALFDSYVISDACEQCDAAPVAHIGCGSLDGCCGQQDETAEYEVDLGAGGLSNVNCNACASVAGVFVLQRLGRSCSWRYVDDQFCPQTCAPSVPTSPYWVLSIQLWRTGSANCRWELKVLLYVPLDSSSESPCGIHQTTYTTAYEDNGEPCAGTWTLSRNSTVETVTKPCTGNLLATIGLASV